MTIVNTGVNYPIERGATGKFKALGTVNSLSHSLSTANPLVITPAKGNAILLFGLAPDSTSTNTSSVTVNGNLYGDIIANVKLDITDGNGRFYISSGGTITTNAIRAALNCTPAIQFETDEVVTIKNVGTTITIYYSYQEGYLL